MKKVFFLFISLFLARSSFGQEIATMVKLYEISTALGVTNSNPLDTIFISLKRVNIDQDVSEQQLHLLKASEYYRNKDYVNSLYFCRKVEKTFENNDLNVLRNLVLIGSFARLKDTDGAADSFYEMERSETVDPNNMKLIYSEIKNQFPKEYFTKVLSGYFYYHKRLRIIGEIYK